MTWEEYRNNYMQQQDRGDLWRDFQDKFMRLAHEEQGREVVVTNGAALRAMKVVRISCNYQQHPEIWVSRENPEHRHFCLLETPPHGLWEEYDGCISENFRERVRLCVANAGVALGRPKGADPEDFWLHRLYLDLLENNSEQLFAVSDDGGMILSVCLASATFCARLARQAIQQSEPRGQKVSSQPIEPGSLETTERQHLLAAVEELEAEEKRSTVSIAQSSDIAAQGVGSKSTTAAQQTQPTHREKKIWEVIQRGTKGRQYCRELDNAEIVPRRNGVWKEGPRKYVAAYNMGKPWRHRIEDEKSKISRKMGPHKTRQRAR